MHIEVVPYSAEWPARFDAIAARLRPALSAVESARIEHVGSTSVPGLAAKPVIDVDVIVEPGDVGAAIAALETLGYEHRGDLGVSGREAFWAPEDELARNVYVCAAGTANVRNHLAVRDVLRRRGDLRDAYAAVKFALASNADIDIDAYIAGKSEILQRVLADSDLTVEERAEIRRLNGG